MRWICCRCKAENDSSYECVECGSLNTVEYICNECGALNDPDDRCKNCEHEPCGNCKMLDLYMDTKDGKYLDDRLLDIPIEESDPWY